MIHTKYFLLRYLTTKCAVPVCRRRRRIVSPHLRLQPYTFIILVCPYRNRVAPKGAHLKHAGARAPAETRRQREKGDARASRRDVRPRENESRSVSATNIGNPKNTSRYLALSSLGLRPTDSPLPPSLPFPRPRSPSTSLIDELVAYV